MTLSLLHLIVIPLAAVAIAKVVNLWKQRLLPVDWHLYSFKPIDCAFCLAFWINIVTPFAGTWTEKIMTALAAMIVASFIDLRT